MVTTCFRNAQFDAVKADFLNREKHRGFKLFSTTQLKEPDNKRTEHIRGCNTNIL